jgi:NAD(P)-dependent dehydrogenase (short-subunit alcohol dehydrogenase family)
MQGFDLIFAAELAGTPVKINSICPGYCATDLTNHQGGRTAVQGAVAAVRMATLPADGRLAATSMRTAPSLGRSGSPLPGPR